MGRANMHCIQCFMLEHVKIIRIRCSAIFLGRLDGAILFDITDSNQFKSLMRLDGYGMHRKNVTATDDTDSKLFQIRTTMPVLVVLESQVPEEMRLLFQVLH